MSRIEAIVSDFGGVLTTPLMEAFARLQDSHGIPLESFGAAMAHATEQEGGANPLFALEKGEISEGEFLAKLGAGLRAQLGRDVALHDFGETFFGHLQPNEELFAFMRELHRRGYRMAILTNNVREWERHWRAMLPIDEIFELVVDSGFEGLRKPEPEIYELTLARLGVPAEAALFLDDLEVNCEAARALGMHAVHFRSTEQAVAEVEAALTAAAALRPRQFSDPSRSQQ